MDGLKVGYFDGDDLLRSFYVSKGRAPGAASRQPRIPSAEPGQPPGAAAPVQSVTLCSGTKSSRLIAELSMSATKYASLALSKIISPLLI